MNSPSLCHNLVCSYLDQLCLPQDIILVHDIDPVMLIGQCRHLGLWSKALPFSMDNYSPLEKLLFFFFFFATGP